MVSTGVVGLRGGAKQESYYLVCVRVILLVFVQDDGRFEVLSGFLHVGIVASLIGLLVFGVLRGLRSGRNERRDPGWVCRPLTSSSSAAESAWSSILPPGFRSRSPGGRLRSAWASRPPSVSSLASSRRFGRLGSTQSKPCATNNVKTLTPFSARMT